MIVGPQKGLQRGTLAVKTLVSVLSGGTDSPISSGWRGQHEGTI